MIRKILLTFIPRSLLFCTFVAAPLVGYSAEEPSSPAGLLQVGGMHETIGRGQDQGRVSLAEIVGKPHFHGVGALEGLRGEITVLDSVAIVTGVTRDGRPQPMEGATAKATMLVGESIGEWMDVTLTEEVSHEQFDQTIRDMAAGKGIDVSQPFVFVIEGELADVRLHVINGACPIRARMRKLDIEREKQPFELEENRMNGTLVGVYAEDAVGTLTHPATRTHAHLIYIDEQTSERLTGHIERVGLAKGAVLRLPRSGG